MRLWPRSLTARILFVEVLSIAVVLVVVPLLTISLLHQTMKDFQAQDLTAQAREIADGLEPRGDGVRVRLSPALAAAYATPYDGRAFALLDASGRALMSSEAARTLPTVKIPRRTVPTRFELHPLTGISLPVVTGGATVWVVVIQDQEKPGAILDDVVSAFLWRDVAFLVLALALLPLINSLLIRQLVGAVQRVSHHAATIGPDSLDKRLDEADLPTEVIELVHAANGLLARLQQSFEAQREFIGNVVHELRTPLAALRIQLDRLTDADARQRLSQSLDRATHVLSQLRDLAQLETLEMGQRCTFDLCAVARELVEESAPDIYAAGDSIDLVIPDQEVTVVGEPTLARLALNNLIANASRHTPAGTAISVIVTADGMVAVADTGPGISSEAQEWVAKRFWRADQRRSDSAGLGLSIVQRIIQVHRGRFEIASEPGHGAVFRLFFPRS